MRFCLVLIQKRFDKTLLGALQVQRTDSPLYESNTRNLNCSHTITGTERVETIFFGYAFILVSCDGIFIPP